MAEKLTCTRCNFKWKTATGRIPNKCPYCGKQDCVIDADSGNEGFRDVDDLLK